MRYNQLLGGHATGVLGGKMKKVFVILIFAILSNISLSARTYFNFEDFFKAKNILKVSKKILDIPLNDFSVAYLSNEECRILRNSIFFYHGYEFQSEDLKQYFFNYYSLENESPEKTSKKELSEIDNKNVQLIKLYEKREEKSEEELKKQKLPDQFIGEWFLESFIIGNDSTASLTINKDNTFILIPADNGGGSYVRAYKGKIYIFNKTLYLYIQNIILSSEKRMGYFDPQYDDKAKRESYSLTLDKSIILSFPVTFPERSETVILEPYAIDIERVTDEYIHMNIGSMIFLKK